jgi:SAM-dependent methyltransferase
MGLQDFPPNGEQWDDPFDIDTTVAHPARRYNYWLGGKDNFEADRISGDAVVETFPTMKIAALENRRFLRRAVAFLVKEAGVRQFLDIGTGIPSADNVHEVAQEIAPEARVVYVDNDPIVLAHARRLLASAPGGATAYIHADLREPDAIFAHPDLRETLDLSRPVALMLVAVLHFFPESADPYGCVARLTGALPTGSYLAATHATTDFMPAVSSDTIDAAVKRESARSRDPGQFRDKTAFARFFAGMELVPPGIVSVSEWRSDNPPGERPSAADTMSYGAVARIS